MKTFLKAFGAVAALLFVAVAMSAHADGVGVKIQPALYPETTVDKGQSLTLTFQATNETDAAQTYYVQARDIQGMSDNGQPQFVDASQTKDFAGFGITTWLSLPKDPIVIGAHQTKSVSVPAAVAQDATPGEHFGAIFLVDQASHQNITNGSGVGYQVGMIVSLKMAGTAVEDAQIREFTTDKAIYSKPSVTFNTTVENLGNVLLRPHGVIEISNMFGNKVASITVNDDGGAILPNAKRTFAAAWNGSGFSFGRYHAVLSMAYGVEGSKTVSEVASFWVLPMNVIGPILIALLILILVLYVGVRLYVKRQLGGASPVQSKPFSRLVTMVVGVILFVIVFLGVMFIVFG